MRPEEAKQLYESEALKEVFQLLRDRCHKEFEGVDVQNKDEMQTIRIELAIIPKVYAVLTGILNDEMVKRYKE